MPIVCYRSRARTVWIPLRTSTQICRLGEGHDLPPWECRLSVWKSFQRWLRKCCQLENRVSWWCLLQCTCSSNQSVSLQNGIHSNIKLNICISDFHFLWMKEFLIIVAIGVIIEIIIEVNRNYNRKLLVNKLIGVIIESSWSWIYRRTRTESSNLVLLL